MQNQENTIFTACILGEYELDSRFFRFIKSPSPIQFSLKEVFRVFLRITSNEGLGVHIVETAIINNVEPIFIQNRNIEGLDSTRLSVEMVDVKAPADRLLRLRKAICLEKYYQSNEITFRMADTYAELSANDNEEALC